MTYSNLTGISIVIIWKYHNSLSSVNYFCNLGCVGHISGRLVPSDAVCPSVSLENYPKHERFMCCKNSISEQKCNSLYIRLQAVTASIIIFTSWLYHCLVLLRNAMHVTCYSRTQYFKNFLEISCSLILFFRDCHKSTPFEYWWHFCQFPDLPFTVLSWIFSIFAVFRSIHVLQLSGRECILHNNLRSYLLLLLYFLPVSLELVRQCFCMSVHKATPTFILLLTLKKRLLLQPCFISVVLVKPQTLRNQNELV